MDYNGGGGGNRSSVRSEYNEGLDNFFNFPELAREWMAEHPVIASLIVAGIVFLVVLFIVLTWLSSRGKFMFLYNVVNDKAEVVSPWKAYARQGNSLFIWRLIYGLVSLFIVMASLYYAYLFFQNMYFNHVHFTEEISGILGYIFWFLILIIVFGYISLFLSDFVVPIMYKHRLSASQAWYKFMQILWPKLGYFILYGLFIFVLGILVVIAIIIFGFVTCCIGFLMLMIPYLGSVLLLPVSYTYRAYSIEFLSQFGEEFTLLAETTEETPLET